MFINVRKFKVDVSTRYFVPGSSYLVLRAFVLRTRYFVLITHYSLLITHYSLLIFPIHSSINAKPSR